MRSLFLKIANPFIFIVLACFAVGLQTSLFQKINLQAIQPEWTLLWVLWFALARNFVEGSILTLILGSIAETQSAAPRGFFMFAYLSCYFSVRLMFRLFLIQQFEKLVLLTILTTLLFYVSLAILFWQFHILDSGLVSLLTHAIPTSIMNALTGFLLFKLFRKIDRWSLQLFQPDSDWENVVQSEGK